MALGRQECAVGLLRFCVVFLLGLGVALGAYATGGLDYISRQHFVRSWSGSGHDMVLRVSGSGLNGACTEHYAIDNRSNRRVLVVFSPGAGGFAGHGREEAYGTEGDDNRYGNAGGYTEAREEFRPADGDYPRRDVSPRYPQDDVASPDDQAPPPVEVQPGEQKIIGRDDGAQVAEASGSNGPIDDPTMTGARCGEARVVRLQLRDCTADDGVCVAGPNSAGEANPQGDE
jgi:hypothetical protein